jgi:Fe2+ or Zn2+ uptake regulation protein
MMMIVLAVGFCLGFLVSENMELAIPSFQSSSIMPAFTSIQNAGPKDKSRTLPTFNEGGVVIFFHVAKTGGTSIRSIFGDRQRIPTVYLETVYNASHFLNSAALIDRVLTKNTTFDIGKNVLFLETHGLNAPALPFMHPHIQRWREMAAEHGTSFFTFTIIRDPVSYAVSYFNFFNAAPCTLGFCPWRLYMPTEGNLVQTTEANNQCLLMARDHWGIFMQKNRTAPTPQECDNVYDLLLQDMDWVGTTEAMSEETIPLLTYMLSRNMTLAQTPIDHTFNVMSATKNESSVLKRSSLHPTTVDYIRSMSYLDQENYNRAQRDFPLEMWDV